MCDEGVKIYAAREKFEAAITFQNRCEIVQRFAEEKLLQAVQQHWRARQGSPPVLLGISAAIRSKPETRETNGLLVVV